MYTVELYVKVRRAVMVEGKNEREVARFYGIHRHPREEDVRVFGAPRLPAAEGRSVAEARRMGADYRRALWSACGRSMASLAATPLCANT